MLRRLFLGAAALVLAGCAYGPKEQVTLPPIVFVHGNGDSSANWQTTIWRFETNGWPRDRLFALQQPYPLARDDDTVAQPGRSSSAQSMAFLKTEVDKVLHITGAKQVVLVGNSRGGLTIRNYIQNGGGTSTVSHAILGGTPNHGVWATPGTRENNEFSGTGAFIKGLNASKNDAGDEVIGPVKWMTIRSDMNDKYAQPDGEWIGSKGKPTGVSFDGPELKGAFNVVLPNIDHRETSFSPAAFAEMYKFLTGKAPQWMDIWPEFLIELDGMATGMGVKSEDKATGSFSNNLPIPKSRVEVYAVHNESALRYTSEPVYSKVIGPDGRWGPFKASPNTHYEFVVRAPGYATTHIYRSPFLRSSNVVNLRADRILDADLPAFSIINLVRPRGYLDPTAHAIKFDGQSPPPGVPVARVGGIASSKIKLDKLINRPIAAEFHMGPTDLERVVGRTWPAKESHVVWLEFTQ